MPTGGLDQCIDLCSGAEGWGVAARELGIDTLGIELDDAPVAVARAAGFSVLQADMALLDPLDFAPCPGIIGSPPCPTFSSAGRGAGRDLDAPILAAIADLAAGRDTRARRRKEAYAILEPETAHLAVLPVSRQRRKREQRAASPVDRDRIARREAKRATARRDAAISLLVVEPLRWVLALEPRWVALEQVPPVLPIWEAAAVVLRERGYSVWTGVLSSERYGVAQTRKRAILIASLDREMREPPATHQRYVAPRECDTACDTDALFEAPDPERIVLPEDRHLLPWVSMAEALRWGMTARPSVSVSAKAGQTAREKGKWAYRLARGEGMTERYGARPDTPVDQPAPAITTKARTASWIHFVANGQANATCRDIDEPAPTIATGNSTAERRWEVQTDNFTGSYDAGEQRRYRRPVEAPAPTVTRRIDTWRVGPPGAHKDAPQAWKLRSGQSVAGEGRAERSADDPSLSVISRFDLCESVAERPSTSVNCDPRIAEPRRHDPEVNGSQYGPATVRVSVEEAAALQDFPPDHPWMAAGSRTAAFRCVGNAVPCGLAAAIISMASGRDL